MYALPRLLVLAAVILGGYGYYTESTPLIVAAVAIAVVFLGGYMFLELRQTDPWEKHREDAKRDP